MPDPDSSADSPFHYAALKDGRVMIYAQRRLAKTLRGKDAARFLAKAEGGTPGELQLLMAKVTGQFKFGNERK